MVLTVCVCVCVHAGCGRALGWTPAALAGAGLVHGPVGSDHSAGSLLQLLDLAALRGALGSPAAAGRRPVQQSAEGAASCAHLPGGHLLQV